jgi:hypothetical protein
MRHFRNEVYYQQEPNLVKKWHRVSGSISYPINWEIFRWCEETCLGRWSLDYSPFFEFEEDAAHFKLVWG